MQTGGLTMYSGKAVSPAKEQQSMPASVSRWIYSVALARANRRN